MSKADRDPRRRPPSFQRYALCPKPIGVRRTTLPTFPDECGDGLARFLGALSTDERRALAAIVEEADLIEVNGASFLLARVTPDILDTLAAFGECEERENDLEDEPSEDREHDIADTEASLQGATGAPRGINDDREGDACWHPVDEKTREQRVLLMRDWRRGMAEITKLNRFLRSRGKDGVSRFSRAGAP